MRVLPAITVHLTGSNAGNPSALLHIEALVDR